MLWTNSNYSLVTCFYREWEEACESAGNTLLPVEEWMRRRIHSLSLDLSDPNEADLLLLSNPPLLTCKRHSKMKAYGNHWRVEDEVTNSWTNYDCGVACFEATDDVVRSGVDYVGILQDILVPDYGDLNTQVIIFSCAWKKRTDNHNNSTYVRDADGFLVVNFKHNIPKSVDPFAFPSQCTQVFFSDDDLRPKGSQWKVVLRKEARGRRKVEEDDDLFISTNASLMGGVVSGSSLLNQSAEPNLTGAIVLNDVDNAIAMQGFDDDATNRVNGKRKRKTQ